MYLQLKYGHLLDGVVLGAQRFVTAMLGHGAVEWTAVRLVDRLELVDYLPVLHPCQVKLGIALANGALLACLEAMLLLLLPSLLNYLDLAW